MNDPADTDKQVAIRAINGVPMVSADQYAHMGKYAGAAVMAAFEMIGGVSRLAKWADGNPTDFFTKVMPKIVQRSTAVEHSGTLTIDDAISRLERNGEITEADYTAFDEMPLQEFDL